jgi:transposase
MQVDTSNLQFADATVVNYINDIKSNYERQITELKNISENKDHQIHKLNNNVIEAENKYLLIKEKYDLLIYKRFMRSSEQLPHDDAQPMLFTPEAEPVKLPESEEPDSKDEPEKIEVKSHSRIKCGRKPIDPGITRVERIIDIPEEDKTCACGAQLTRIGEEISEKLIIIEPQIRVDKIVRPKYACRCCEGTSNEMFEDEEKPTVRIAPVEPAMIPRSIATPSLLSWVFTHKFEDHLPYYRQEKQFERIGVDISRQDMSNWQQQVFNRLEPLFELLKGIVKSGPVIQMDETSVQVMSGIKNGKPKDENTKPDIHTGWMWLARGGPAGKTVVWYEYHESRAGKHAKDFLEGYSGYLQTDGHDGYDYAVKENPGIIHVGCFAHARRYFFEASKVSKVNKSAEEGIKYIRKLYEVENKLRSEKLNEEEFLRKRKEAATPILSQFKSWLHKRALEVPPTNLLGKAITYSLNQWEKMTAYLESYSLTPDNNACENAIRPFVIGRKNWLLCGSPEGAKSSCGIYSLIETAKQNGLIPFKYLMALFEKAPLASTSDDWEKLLPWNIFTA